VKSIVLSGLLLAACTPKTPEAGGDQFALGERAFQKCYSCHTLEPGRNDLSGPTLYGIVGRRIAAESGFDYSPALRKFGEVEGKWGKGLLDKFISDPEAIVPGTSMMFHGMSDEAERAALIAYLERQTSASAASLP
jgi:cytochrome c